MMIIWLSGSAESYVRYHMGEPRIRQYAWAVRTATRGYKLCGYIFLGGLNIVPHFLRWWK